MITVSICGNPNVGKTVLFNALTGMKQKVGNFPGVTIQKKEGYSHFRGQKIKFVDLPGIYGLGTRSLDEKVARDYLLDEDPDVIVNIVNAGNLERNLFLTLQLIEMGKNVILAVNMLDEAEANGISINLKVISRRLAIPVVGLVATEGKGLEELKQKIIQYHDRFTRKHNVLLRYDDRIEKVIAETSKLIRKSDLEDYFPERWLGLMIIEGDEGIAERLKRIVAEDVYQRILDPVRNSIKDREEVKLYIISEKYDYISHLVKQAVLSREEEVWPFTDLLDHVFTHDVLGWFIFVFLMWLGFRLTFDVGEPFSLMIEEAVGMASIWLKGWITQPFLQKLLADGIIGGVGAVLVFLPNIFLLFLFLGILEDSGYLSRAAFVADRLMSRFGVTGKSLIPILFGFGCNVPAIMSTRTIASPGERFVSIMINPFVSCSARFAVYIFLCRLFFKSNAALVLSIIYTLNILIIMALLVLFKHVFLKGQESMFLLEMPPYRKPVMKNAVLYAWMNGKHFITKAFSIILVASLVIWLLTNFPVSGDIENSYLGKLSKAIAPVFSPLGFDWRGTMAILSGFSAKEVIISTFEMLSASSGKPVSEFLKGIFDYQTTLVFIVFIMLYMPCAATVYAMKQETGKWKAAFLNVLFSTFVAYGGAMCMKLILMMTKGFWQ